MEPFDRSHTSSYWRSIVIMALYCIIFEIKRLLIDNRDFFHIPSAFDASVREVPVGILHIRVDTIHQRVERDGRTEIAPLYRPSYMT